MTEKNENNTLIRNYTSNFAIKEYIQETLIPKAFPDIPVGKLNLGLTGIVSEYISQLAEDSHSTAALMANEAFITRAVLPNSIYSAASVYDLGYTFATPSRCNFCLQLYLPDVKKYSTKVDNNGTHRYYLDKNTTLVMSDNTYSFDYDIIIDYRYIDGNIVFNVYYDIDNSNSISQITSEYVKHRVSGDWLILYVELNEFKRVFQVTTLSDNLVTTNSDVSLAFSDQIAGIDVVYVSPQGERSQMKLKGKYTKEEIEPFAWYQFNNDHQITLSFSSSNGYFVPAFNSKIESTIYTCRGAKANFDSYDRNVNIPIQKSGEVYEYNLETKMAALCFTGSTGGLDRGNIELLRDDVILARNSANVLTTEHDLNLWFNRMAKRYGTHAKFFKRRDDPTGTLFAQFIAIKNDTYTYPTNTLTMHIEPDQFDFINNDENGINKEFIIKPGHIWEYDIDFSKPLSAQSRDRVKMVMGTSGPAMITDDVLPTINTTRPFMFVNPFYIKISRNPTMSVNYNYLLNYTFWPDDIKINNDSFYQFQMAACSIERSMSRRMNNQYRIQVSCVPVVSSNENIEYVSTLNDASNTKTNNLRIIMVTCTKENGETGYIEMIPIENRSNGSILFEANIAVLDNIKSNMQLEVDMERTNTMKSLMNDSINQGKVLIDANETSFHFITLMKNNDDKISSTLFNDDSFNGYTMTNRFLNDSHELTLYQPMNMMRSVITFSGENNNYSADISLVPLLKYDIPLDDEKMSYFIRAFDDQYAAMKPALSKMIGNSFIDFKLYNTYGMSSNYYIGPKDDDPVLKNSDLILDSVYIKIKLRLAVKDRSIYTQTAESVINLIKTYFDKFNTENMTEIHATDLINFVCSNQANVKYIRFIGFNEYDANKQSIFIKDNTDDMQLNKLQMHVPEMLRVDDNSIDIVEEV